MYGTNRSPKLECSWRPQQPVAAYLLLIFLSLLLHTQITLVRQKAKHFEPLASPFGQTLPRLAMRRVEPIDLCEAGGSELHWKCANLRISRFLIEVISKREEKGFDDRLRVASLTDRHRGHSGRFSRAAHVEFRTLRRRISKELLGSLRELGGKLSRVCEAGLSSCRFPQQRRAHDSPTRSCPIHLAL